jgi:Flp pilus assembly protein TadB
MTPPVYGAVVGVGAWLIFRAAREETWPVSLRSRGEEELVKRHRSNMAIVGIDEKAFVARASIVVLGSIVVAVTGFLLIGVLGLSISPLVLPVLVMVAPVLSLTVLTGQLQTRARQRRMSFGYALSSYLDLVNVLLAGGAGTETALHASAKTGDNWAFSLLRDALDRSRAERIAPWFAFAQLGQVIGVVDLERIAGSMQLAGEQGAKVRVSLAAQADALRSRQVSEIEAAAQAATERMGVPTVLLFTGFIALLGYPALDLVVGNM